MSIDSVGDGITSVGVLRNTREYSLHLSTAMLACGLYFAITDNIAYCSVVGHCEYSMVYLHRSIDGLCWHTQEHGSIHSTRTLVTACLVYFHRSM